MWLAHELTTLMPDEPDTHALCALVTLHDARRLTRVDTDGALVPLDEQDRSRWDAVAVARGLRRLRKAAGATGPYLPQAVIAALHATAPTFGQTDWAGVCARRTTACSRSTSRPLSARIVLSHWAFATAMHQD